MYLSSEIQDQMRIDQVSGGRMHRHHSISQSDQRTLKTCHFKRFIVYNELGLMVIIVYQCYHQTLYQRINQRQ